ncbi:hypothetical protein [Nostoc sp.]|uniref:hypothetical protein n=1 Tax=Nostoc sp. TaxID=1180 RepID=UPI002FF6BE8F
MATDNILDTFAEIISQFQAIPGNQINLEQLNNTEEKLLEIFSQLQFELLNAQNQRNWKQINKLELALTECKLPLNSVRAAIINVSVIGINRENIAQMQKILEEIDTARKTQANIDFAIHLLGFLRKLFL